MGKGYAEGPAAEEAVRRQEERERETRAEPDRSGRLAVYGSTPDNGEKHFIGWRDDVDPDALFAAGKAWGISIVRRCT